MRMMTISQKMTPQFFVFFLLAPCLIQSISIIGPKALRPFVSYRVAIAGDTRSHSVYVAVEGRRANGEQFTQGREVQVPAVSSRLVDIDVGDPGPGQYSLVARSTSGPSFASNARLVYQPRSFCIFIQTDKQIYQPGDIINFRVIALDKYLLPLSELLDVSILDTHGTPVRQWASALLDRGVLTKEFLLADEPTLGEWTIQVESRGQTYSRQILVADYVMPKFHMEMQMKKEMLFSEGRFTINITAKHFNGLPVRGELTMSAYAVFFSGLLQPVFNSPARKVVEFNGQTEVVYDLKTDLDLAEDAARPLVVEAVLEESDTLIKQNISSRILLLRTPYRLRVTAPDYFKPELPYNVQIEVVDSSGQIIETNEDVSVERLWDDGAPLNTSTLALKKGVATYITVPDKAHTNSTLNLVIKYKEVTERVVNVQRNADSGGHFLTIELLTQETSVGDEMRARISSTEPMDLVHYVVIGRGDIIVAETLELTSAKRSVDISVSVTSAMAPGCVFLAWYPRVDPINNTMLSSAIYVPQNKLLQHQVSVTPTSAGSMYRPNGLVELQTRGEPGSLTAVLGVDTTAVAAGLSTSNGLGSGLDMHTIEREVESFSGLKHSLFKNEDHLPGMGLDLGGYTTGDVFKNAGVVILSDGILEKSPYEGEPLREIPETGTRPPLAGPYAFSRLPTPPSPRYYLTLSPQPTWMLDNYTISNDGTGTKQSLSPNMPGEWMVGAFAIHPTLGLGLAEPKTFTSSEPLTISAELPETLQRGETVAAVIILKSSMPKDALVEIVFHNSEQYFEFEPLDNNLDSSKKIELYRSDRVTVPARGSTSTAFLVTAVRTGPVSVIVQASGDGVDNPSLFRTINVKDGYEEEWWSWGLLDARSGVARSNVTLAVPAGARLGPVSLVGSGSLLGAALHALREGGASAPAGDPPHALRPLAIATVILDYLQAIGKDDKSLMPKARAQVEAGYQRLMAYRRPDGSFASDMSDEAVGDVWMTATAARWLSRAARYLEVSPTVATGAARWLAAQQNRDGSWSVPPAPLRNDPHAQAPLSLAAHALLALQHIKGSDTLFRNVMNKAEDYIARNLSPDKNAYSLAVASCALARAKSPLASEALLLLDKYTNTTGTVFFWSRHVAGNEWRNPWLKDNSFEARTSAWGIRAMLASGLLDKATPVARFLLQAYNLNDQDPEVLDALAEFAGASKTTSNLRVSLNITGSEEIKQLNIDDNNALTLQEQLIRNGRSALAMTEGRGMAVVGLRARTYTNSTAAWPRYTLDPRVDAVSTKYRLQLSICIGFVPIGNETESGLALLTVQLPSGYVADINTLSELTAARHVASARLAAGGSRVVAWVRTRAAESCATLAAPRALPTARQRPGWATLQDLYDSSHRARVFFNAVSSTACDACRAWAACARVCGASARRSADSSAGAGTGTDSDNARTARANPDAAATHSLALAAALLPAALLLLR